MSNLYIIGNGFDIAHGIQSSYKSFSSFVNFFYPKDYLRIGTIYGNKKCGLLWRDYESKLALSSQKIRQSIKRNVPLWGSLSYHPVCRYLQLTKAFDTLSVDINRLFHAWIDECLIGQVNSCHPLFDLSNSDYYLSFNYTSTLESLYKIGTTKTVNGSSNICHIHGSIGNGSFDSPIVGHSLSDAVIDRRTYNCYGYAKRLLIKNKIASQTLLRDIIDGYKGLLSDTRKDIGYCINQNRSFFDLINKVIINEVFILGASLGYGDVNYIKVISNSIGPQVKWHVSYYSQKEKNVLKNRLSSTIKTLYPIDIRPFNTFLINDS